MGKDAAAGKVVLCRASNECLLPHQSHPFSTCEVQAMRIYAALRTPYPLTPIDILRNQMRYINAEIRL
jgi:hypothetical protein